MPRIFEAFGYRLEDKSKEAESCRKAAHCPFMDRDCDGGGNRYLSNINLTKSKKLKTYFGGKKEVPSGVCSLQLRPDENPWIVCPRRLLALGRHDGADSPHQKSAETFLFKHSGYAPGTRLGVWSELKMKYAEKANGVEKSFDYSFDYILMPLVRTPQEEIEKQLGIEWETARPILEETGFSLAKRQGKDFVEDFPNGNPVIVEIMTSSTSGGNKTQRTTIPMAFEDAMLEKPHDAPGINYRQVWARMVSQLIVKSEVGISWVGKTFWILQDALVNYISSSTALDVRKFLSEKTSEVNMVCLSYGNAFRSKKGIIELKESKLFAGPIASSPRRADAIPSFQDMIRAPICPPKSKLLNLLVKRKASNTLLVH